LGDSIVGPFEFPARRNLYELPARSPISHLGFIFCGRHLKNYIYREPVNNLKELNDRIHEALATVTSKMLRLARENLIKRAHLRLRIEGHL
jgi:hypothetical protein